MIDFEFKIPAEIGYGGSLAALTKLSLFIWLILWIFCLKFISWIAV